MTQINIYKEAFLKNLKVSTAKGDLHISHLASWPVISENSKDLDLSSVLCVVSSDINELKQRLDVLANTPRSLLLTKTLADLELTKAIIEDLIETKNKEKQDQLDRTAKEQKLRQLRKEKADRINKSISELKDEELDAQINSLEEEL